MAFVKLVLSYDGTRYVGWQAQSNGPSVQAELERALSALHKEPVRVTGAGRTDSGVHALGQVASLAVERPLPPNAYVKGLNALLPEDIAIRHAEVRDAPFDARRDARGKRYRYRIENLPTRAPLGRLQAWQVFRPLDVGAMRSAAAPLLGRHDFGAFRAADCEAHHAVRELRRLDVEDDGAGRIEVVAEATAFLRHMVRNLVGTLVEVGLGAREPGSMAALLESRDRSLAGRTAPPQGLVLEEVFYDG
ncbi:MAG: tRNA pseudouridine(38-40) synthase TruA [Deltaproteobacteria bacterium]